MEKPGPPPPRRPNTHSTFAIKDAKIQAVSLGTLRIGKDGMNLTGVIPKVTCPTTLTETEEDPDPGTPDPTLILNAVAMTAAKQVRFNLN